MSFAIFNQFHHSSPIWALKNEKMTKFRPILSKFGPDLAPIYPLMASYWQQIREKSKKREVLR